MLDENGDPINLDKCMMADSTATVVGAMLGTSTCTTFVESATGVSAGGRTGLTSVTVAICFFLCLFLTPLASVVPACATAPALVYVGVLMLGNIKKIDMTDLASAAVGFMTVISMLLTYSIANGIGIGAITYTVITIFTGKYTSKDIMVTIIALLFALKFCMITM
ncbi:MAG: NCS2 family permease, partial [Firmicutes bacterium]|nr:NCS2 family permease [Bacillota bacterium]